MEDVNIFKEFDEEIVDQLTSKKMLILNGLYVKKLVTNVVFGRLKSQISSNKDHEFFQDMFNIVHENGKMKEFKDILRKYASKDLMSIIADPPKAFFVEELQDNSFVVGSNFSLQCKLSKLYSVIWLKDGAKITDDSVKIEAFGYNHKITITKPTKYNAGKYSCKCGEAETTCKAEVEETPEMMKKKIETEFEKYPKELLVQRLVEAKVEIKEKEEKIDELEITIKSITEKNATANKELQDLKNEQNTYKRQIKMLTETVNYLQDKLNETNDLVKKQLEAIDKLKQNGKGGVDGADQAK